MLEGKNVFVTGTNRGIGKAILTECAKNGANIWAHARHETDEFKELVQNISRKFNVEIWPIYFDLTDNDSMLNAFRVIRNQKLNLDVLINNAGVMQDALIGMISDNLIEKTFQVNVYAPIKLLQFAAKLMMRQKSGSIINMSSIVGVNGNKGQTVYSSSKGAIISLTKTAAKELAFYNIRVNALAPGMIDTDMFRSIGEDKQKLRIENIEMGRIGTPVDVANACVFLASDMSSYITGQILGVDGSAIV